MAKTAIVRVAKSTGLKIGGFKTSGKGIMKTSPSKLVNQLGRAPTQELLTKKRVRAITGK